jgi:hypothetical protein
MFTFKDKLRLRVLRNRESEKNGRPESNKMYSSTRKHRKIISKLILWRLRWTALQVLPQDSQVSPKSQLLGFLLECKVLLVSAPV